MEVVRTKEEGGGLRLYAAQRRSASTHCWVEVPSWHGGQAAGNIVERCQCLQIEILGLAW